MNKQWEDLNQSEKIEDLRKDVKKIFSLLSQFQDVIARDESGAKSQATKIDQRLGHIGQIVNDLLHRLERVEKKVH